jgi:hypothetical protein
VLLSALVSALLFFTVWYGRNMVRWTRYLKEAGAAAPSLAERKAILASPEYRALRRSVRLPLNLAAACCLLLYLVLQWR